MNEDGRRFWVLIAGIIAGTMMVCCAMIFSPTNKENKELFRLLSQQDERITNLENQRGRKQIQP